MAMTQHNVNQGDCVLSIAAQYGMPWQRLWDDPANASLKALRKDPSTLYPGDVLKIPERELRTEERSTNKRHRFLRKRDLAKVRIRILMDNIPKAHEPFKLVVGEREMTGKTDGNGFLEANIPPEAADGILSVGSGSEKLRFPVKFGFLDPVTTDSGVQQRLRMLGFGAGVGIAESINAFQSKHNLQKSGSAEETTRQQIQKEFGQ